jgi:uncharacterized membrane protein YeiB
MAGRVVGFDLARAYALWGMFIVNFNVAFGTHEDRSPVGHFLTLFNGNSSTAFVMLAGMGVALMSSRGLDAPAARAELRRVLLKRAAFLLALGMLLYSWWPADILRAYGLYLAAGALFMFAPRRWSLLGAAGSIAVFHLLFFVVPYETGWHFPTLVYADFWTVRGWLRNSFYNGFNPVFPWLGFFLVGLYLGRLDWGAPATRRRVLGVGLALYVPVAALQLGADWLPVSEGLRFFLHADYLPPLLPFVLSTMGFALVLIAAAMTLGGRRGAHGALAPLAAAGQLTLTHYVAHLVAGMLLLAALSGRPFAGTRSSATPVRPLAILAFATAYFAVSVLASALWRRRFSHGPLELLMRRVSRERRAPAARPPAPAPGAERAGRPPGAR